MAWLLLATLLSVAATVTVGPLLHRQLRRRQIALATQIRSACGIVEERFVRIGGIDQWVGIRREDRDNPVLFLIHGGPGASSSIFTPLIRSWENHFTVVQWDQRGGGKTLGRTGNGAAER